MNVANERINIINVIILEYRVRIDPTCYFIIYSDFSYISARQADSLRSRRS